MKDRQTGTQCVQDHYYKLNKTDYRNVYNKY